MSGFDDSGYRLDAARVARGFGAASERYDAAATLQAEVRAELLSRAATLAPAPREVLDLGCGTGAGADALKRRHRRARVVAADIAPGMLAAARRRSRFWRPLITAQADVHQLPFEDARFDLVFSNLMLQWADPLDLALAEIRRVLAPGGLLLATTFGPPTLMELREAWATVDDAVHVNRFVDMHDFGGALARAGFAEPVLDVDRHVRRHAEVGALLGELKTIGAHNVNAGRPRGLTGRGALSAMVAAYEARRDPRGLPSTWEVIYVAAWAPTGEAGGRRRGGLPGETVVPVADLRTRRRTP